MSDQARTIGDIIAGPFRRWHERRRLEREQRRRDDHKQHWQCCQIGGGAIVQLGHMTESQAIRRVQILKGDNEPIAFVDFERGFIAHGRHPAELAG